MIFDKKNGIWEIKKCQQMVYAVIDYGPDIINNTEFLKGSINKMGTSEKIKNLPTKHIKDFKKIEIN